MTFSASYHKGSGGASFSRVGLHGGRGLALALGGWRGKEAWDGAGVSGARRGGEEVAQAWEGAGSFLCFWEQQVSHPGPQSWVVEWWAVRIR